MKRRRWLAVGVAAGLVGLGLTQSTKGRLRARIVEAQRRGLALRAQQPPEQRDIRFKPGSDVALDVFAPSGATGCPVVVNIHGGGWMFFPRWLFTFSAPPLVSAGLVVVLPDYTLYPHAQAGQMADEVAAAVAWTIEHIAAYGGDPRRVYLQGHSAGAQLAALVALDPRWLAAYGHSPAEIAGLAVSGAVMDVEALQDYWQRRSPPGVSVGPQWSAFGHSRAGQREFSPVNYVRAGAPPTLVAHGERDRLVPGHIPRAFYEALVAAGVDATWRAYPGKGHVDTLFDAALDADAPLHRDLLALIARTAPSGKEERLGQGSAF